MAAEEDLRHLMLQSCNAISFYSIPVLRVQGPVSGSHLHLAHLVPASVRTLIANLLHKLPLSIFDDMMIHNIWRTELCSIHHSIDVKMKEPYSPPITGVFPRIRSRSRGSDGPHYAREEAAPSCTIQPDCGTFVKFIPGE